MPTLSNLFAALFIAPFNENFVQYLLIAPSIENLSIMIHYNDSHWKPSKFNYSLNIGQTTCILTPYGHLESQSDLLIAIYYHGMHWTPVTTLVNHTLEPRTYF